MVALDKKDENRFWLKVDKQFLGCWLWAGSMFSSTGYGGFKTKSKFKLAHRLSYQLMRGSIAAGLQLDHLCRVRNCVNPDHLEIVTRKENLLRGASFSAENARKTHCKRGHEFTPANLFKSKEGKRICRTCGNIRSKKQREKRRNESGKMDMYPC